MRSIAVVVLVLFFAFVAIPPAQAEASDAGLIAAVVAVAIGVPFIVAKWLIDAFSPSKPEPEKKAAPEEKKPGGEEPQPAEKRAVEAAKPPAVGPEQHQIFED